MKTAIKSRQISIRFSTQCCKNVVSVCRTTQRIAYGKLLNLVALNRGSFISYKLVLLKNDGRPAAWVSLNLHRNTSSEIQRPGSSFVLCCRYIVQILNTTMIARFFEIKHSFICLSVGPDECAPMYGYSVP